MDDTGFRSDCRELRAEIDELTLKLAAADRVHGRDGLLDTTLLQLETKTAENTDLKMEIERLKGHLRQWIPGFDERYPNLDAMTDVIRKRNGRDPVPSDGDVEMDEDERRWPPIAVRPVLDLSEPAMTLNRYIGELQAMEESDRMRIIRSIVAYFGAG